MVTELLEAEMWAKILLFVEKKNLKREVLEKETRWKIKCFRSRGKHRNNLENPPTNLKATTVFLMVAHL